MEYLWCTFQKMRACEWKGLFAWFSRYNCISLGLTAWAIFAINKRKDVAAAVLFSLALNYKQMSLYLAFPFFFYLLGRCRELPVQKG